jgi:hypothetical protein
VQYGAVNPRLWGRRAALRRRYGGWHTSHSCLTGVGASHEDDRSLREGLAAPDGGQQQQLVSALSMRGCELSPRRRESSSEPARWSTDGPVPPISCCSILTLTIPVSEFPPPNGLRTPTRPGGSPASTPVRSPRLRSVRQAFPLFRGIRPRSHDFSGRTVHPGAERAICHPLQLSQGHCQPVRTTYSQVTALLTLDNRALCELRFG